MACLVFGSILDFAALAFAAQSLIATLGSFTLVSNVILAPLNIRHLCCRTAPCHCAAAALHSALHS